MQKWLNVAKLFCKKQDITLSIKAGNIPSTNGKVINLPSLPSVLKNDHRNQLLWWLIHESNHINETDFEHDYSTSKYPLQTIHRMTNSFEDLRIDAMRIRNEPNLLMYMSGRIRLLLEENAAIDNPYSLTYAVSVIPLAESHQLECGNIYSEKLKDELKTYLQQEDNDLYEKVVNACDLIRDKVKAMCQDENSETKHAFELAEEYLDLIQCFEQKPDEDDSDEKSDDETDDEAGNGGSDGDSEGDETDDEAGNGGSDGDSEGDETDDEAGNGGSDGDSEGDNSNDESDSNEGKPSTILEFDENEGEGEEHPMAPDFNQLIQDIDSDEDYDDVPKLSFGSQAGWCSDFDVVEKPLSSNLPRFHEIMSGSNREAHNLEVHLEDLLSDLVRSKETYKENGRFTHKSINRYINRRDDAFINVERHEIPARHLSILIDVSGSMGSYDSEGTTGVVSAIKAAGLLLPALDIIDASYSVTTFGDGIHSVKTADELTEVGIARLGALESVVAGSTPMGEALQVALENTPPTAESHDVLIITDGGPNDPDLVNTHAEFASQDAVTTHVLSVGVDPTWASVQINAVFASNLNELDKSLIELVENIILAE